MVPLADEFDRVEDKILSALQENETVTLSELMQRFVSAGENPDIVREVVWGLLDSNMVQLTSDRKLLLDSSERSAIAH
jgi:hypothetical protein